MKLAIICANGKAGQLITKEALERGHDVTAFVRGENRSAAKKAVVKDLCELTKEDLSGYDAVIDAFGAWTAETLPQHVSSLRRLCDLLSGTETRLLVVGGAGSLYADASRTVRVMDTPAFPDGWKPLAGAMGKALEELRTRSDVRWTYVSPAADFQADGAKTGRYLIGGEELPVNSRGESRVSYADYTTVMVNEAEKGAHIKERISVCEA